MERCARVIDEWRQGVRHDDQELWDCRRVLDAGLHPTLHTVIPAPFRLSAFTPVNIPICYGMLNASSPVSPWSIYHRFACVLSFRSHIFSHHR